jgi:hypothetical protein
MSMTRFTIGLAATTLLGGCMSAPAPLSPSFGNAVQHNMALHIINPEGSRVAEIPAHDGLRVVRAQDRLIREEKKNEITLPAFIIGGGGGGK